MKINEQGLVTYLMRTGKDLVKAQMRAADAEKIIAEGEPTKTVDPKYPIAIDDKWFFEGEPKERKGTQKK